MQEPSTTDLQQALGQLTKAEALDFLRRMLEGEPHLDLKLKQRIGLVQPTTEYAPTGTRTIGELLEARKAIQRKRAQTAAAAKEVQRRAEMAALAARGDKAWQEVEALIAEKKTDAYRQAAKLLRKLSELADEQGQSQQFQQRLESIREKYRRRSALMRELRNL